MSGVVYLLWSNKHAMWWKADGWGYTNELTEAGLYSEADAVNNVVRSAQSGQLGSVSCMVAAPVNWTRPVADPVHDGYVDRAAEARADQRDEDGAR